MGFTKPSNILVNRGVSVNGAEREWLRLAFCSMDAVQLCLLCCSWTPLARREGDGDKRLF